MNKDIYKENINYKGDFHCGFCNIKFSKMRSKQKINITEEIKNKWEKISELTCIDARISGIKSL